VHGEVRGALPLRIEHDARWSSHGDIPDEIIEFGGREVLCGIRVGGTGMGASSGHECHLRSRIAAVERGSMVDGVVVVGVGMRG
jgi:hypothetical protein